MRRRSILGVAGAAGTAAVASFLPRWAMAKEARIVGAGASFPHLAYQKWAQLAQGHVGIQVSYEPVGSGGGADRVAAREVDFGGTDSPKRPGMLREQHLIQFPSVLGAVAPYVNLPGVQAGQLRLTGELLADLFLGKLTKWNDKRLAAENAGLRLPDVPVVPVYRAGSSGTTFIFTTYLARVSEAWRDGPRASSTVQWPAGQGADGNAAMAEKVRGTPGAIGYTEASFAKANGLAVTMLRNRAGDFVAPDAASFAKAAEAGDWGAPGFVTDMTDLDAAGAWPIVAPTYVLMPSNPAADRVEASRHTMRFFDWAFRNVGAATAELGFIPLPDSLREPIQATWRKVKGPDGQPVWEA